MKVNDPYTNSILGTILIKNILQKRKEEIQKIKEYKIEKAEKSPRIDYMNEKYSEQFFYNIKKNKREKNINNYIEEIEYLEEMYAKEISEKAKSYKKC